MAMQLDATGPISYLIVEFPGSKMTGEGLAALVDLDDRGVVRVLDLLFLERDTSGDVHVLDVRDIDGDGTLDMVGFEGAASGLMDEDDVANAGSALKPGAPAPVPISRNP